jgi:hypothetical protein
MRIAPSWAVKPQPTVAARARTKPVNAPDPSWSRAWYPCRPTSVPVKNARNAITPTVPPTTDSAPVPSVTSASSRVISFL